MENLLAEGNYVLEKYPGKGGWTYVALPEIKQDKHAYFGWVKVSGSIDDYQIKGLNLMPMGDGSLFMSVKAEIRKKIKKEAGDVVRIVLYADKPIQNVPENLMLCLEDEPTARSNFEQLTESEQNAYIEWIASTRIEEVQVERLIKTIDRLQLGLRFSDKKAKL